VESIVKPVPLDAFIPVADARERYALTVRAPAPLVYQLAHDFDMQSVPLVRGIFRLREGLMGSHAGTRVPRGIVEETRALGWGCLLERPGELFIGGAVCQPWLADVVFRSVPADQFATFAEPGQVRIAWTLEAHPISPILTELVYETRVAATDEAARRRFLSYWRWARVGIYTIRWLLLPAIRREAEWKARH
jgi:hypothetical protein